MRPPNSRASSAKTTRNGARSSRTPASKEIERGQRIPARPTRTGARTEGALGKRCDRRHAARARHPLPRAQSGRELPRPARQHRQLPRQRASAEPPRLAQESAVATGHGYAKASGRMMGAVLHSNVGLMHGSMAIFNAWCDRVPMLILGATGPWDAARRRPWIDWIHTASDQGALVRDYTKWDNQPA